MNLDIIKMYLSDEISSCRAHIDAFRAKLNAVNASHELEWADSVFESAAKVEIFTGTLGVLDGESMEPDVFADYVDAMEKNLLHKASWGSRSTSTSSNLMDRYRLVALAEVVKLLRGQNFRVGRVV